MLKIDIIYYSNMNFIFENVITFEKSNAINMPSLL